MIFRRAKQDQTNSDLESRDRRRRGGGRPGSGGDAEEAPPAKAQPATDRPLGEGPYDADETGHGAVAGDLDLGGLVIRPREGMEMQLQVDQETQAVMSVLLVAGSSAMELRAFAAPRSGSLWPEVRREMAAEATRQGGVATEGRGPFGAEVKLVVPATAEDGTRGTQTTRALGIDGPRWFVRAILYGQAAEDPASDRTLEGVLHDLLVVRGKEPMPPRDLLRLRLPDDARPAAGPES